MVQRIVKLIGDAYSTSGDVHLLATYNGSEIINGTIATTLTDVIPELGVSFSPDPNELVQFETTTDNTGPIPVSITVTGGTLFFRHFWMNYTGFVQERQATDPNTPIDPDDSGTYTWVTTVEPDSHYEDPNTNTVESDGILNLTKNGHAWQWRTDVDSNMLGDWVYPISDGETVTFDFFVDPAKVILSAPVR